MTGDGWPTLLAARGLTKRYGDLIACSDIDLDVRAGEVHAILGENGAGKSTVMKMLYGVERPDAGSIIVDGEELTIRSPRDARSAGIGMVFQHFELVGKMTVTENIALGLEWWKPSRLGDLADRVTAFSDAHGLHLDPFARVEDLPIGLQQRVEIVKALLGEARFLIMDEPTSVLTPIEWTDLQHVIGSLADEGRGIIFIGHKLREALDISHRCTILRRGHKIATVATSETSESELARHMVGREVVLTSRNPPREPGEIVLAVESVSTDRGGHDRDLDDVSFEVREGEVLGVTGIEGNGQQKLADVLTGAIRPSRGSVDRRDPAPGEGARRHPTRQAAIPSDRLAVGASEALTLQENLLVRDFANEPLSRRGWLRPQAMRGFCRSIIERFDVRTPGLDVAFGYLSGGNQQRAVIGREMSRQPTLLVASHPTRGLDVGAIEFVYSIIREHRAAGGATVLISGELDEVLTLSDRFVVLLNGVMSEEMVPGETDIAEIGLKMTNTPK